MDSQTVVFGGMITQSDQIIQRRVPGISEIPLIGRLFRYDYNQTQRTELLIIMTPRVVRNDLDAESLKQLEAGRMSWCLADVQKLHGDSGLRRRGDVWADDETITIYPDADPAGAKLKNGEQLPPPAPIGPALMPEPAAQRGAKTAAQRVAQMPRVSSRNAQAAATVQRPPSVQALPPRAAPRPAEGELKLRPAAQSRPPQNRVTPAEYQAPAPPPGYDPRYAPPGQVQPVIYDAPIDQQRYRR